MFSDAQTSNPGTNSYTAFLFKITYNNIQRSHYTAINLTHHSVQPPKGSHTLRVRSLTMCRGEPSAVIARPMSMCS